LDNFFEFVGIFMRYLIFGVFVSGVLSSCHLEPRKRNPVVTPSEKGINEENGDLRFVGLSKSAARALANREGRMHLVVSEDGKPLLMTRGYRSDRINFTVVKGRVTSVTRG